MRGVKLANTIIYIVLLYLGLAILYLIYKEVQGHSASLLLYSLLGACIILLLLALSLPKSYRINLALFFTSVAFTLYILEGFLFFWGNPLDYRDARYTAAQKNGVSFDTRTPLQVVSDLKQDGIDAYPFVAPSSFLSTTLMADDEEIFVLGSISNKTTVYCNESGTYTIYESDEYGFHNPTGIWGGNTLDMVALGDSFTQGACVPSDKNVVAHIRSVYPKTLNLAYSGNGPLIMLATLKEYVKPLKPPVVLWFYYEGNDLGDLYLEQANPLLRRYLAEKNFSQDLLHRQADVNRVISDYVAELKERERVNATREVIASLRLYHVRRLLNMTREPATAHEVKIANMLDTKIKQAADAKIEQAGGRKGEDWADPKIEQATNPKIEQAADAKIELAGERKEEDRADIQIEVAAETKLKDEVDANHEKLVALFQQILSDTNEEVASWGGKLYFVYLPDHSRYEQADRENEHLLYRTEVLEMVNGLDIPLLDIHQAFRRHPDPLSLFPFRLVGHYTEQGYRMIAEEVLNRVR